jgi:hypothetical protein
MTTLAAPSAAIASSGCARTQKSKATPKDQLLLSAKTPFARSLQPRNIA